MISNIHEIFSVKNEPSSWRKEASARRVEQWLGQARICPACGRIHEITTRQVGAIKLGTGDFRRRLADLGLSGSPLVVMDENTRQAAGAALLEELAELQPHAFVFDSAGLHADEKTVGSLLIEMTNRPAFLISCGSGTLTDIVRLNSLMTGIPFVVFATASSVDGFTSTTTPLIVRGFKLSYPGAAPLAVFYDGEVLAAAPARLTAAGFGDVCAKIIAAIDWRLAFVAEGEDYCPLLAAIVERAVQDSLALAAEAAKAPDDVQQAAQSRQILCVSLLESLILTGLAMQMATTSRPASGAEHQISHLLEMRDIQRGKAGSLHGDKVGIGTLVSMVIYLRMFGSGQMPGQRPALPVEIWEKEVRRVFGPLASQVLARSPSQPPQGAAWEEQSSRIEQAMQHFGYETVNSFRLLLPQVRDLIQKLGGPVRPDQLGYSEQDTYDAIAFGKEVRVKFTALRLAERFGWLYDLADEISLGLPRGTIY